MKHLIIVSVLIINSVFSQIVVEDEIFFPSIPNLDWSIRKQEDRLDLNRDYNGDLIPEIILRRQNYNFEDPFIYLFDVKNSTIIDSLIFSNEDDYCAGFTTISNVTCLDCKDIILECSGFKVWNIDNSYLSEKFGMVGNQKGIHSIIDIDGDGLSEILVVEDYSVVIYGTGTTTASTTTNINPSSFLLNQNYPNPFNPITSINYQVQLSGDVTLNIYDVLGNKIKTLINEPKPVGDYQIKWDGTNQMGEILSSGQYFYQLKVGDFVSTKKMVLLK